MAASGVAQTRLLLLLRWQLREPASANEFAQSAAWEPESEGEAPRHRQWAKNLSRALERDSIPGGYVKPLAPDAYEQIDSAYGCNALRLRRLKKRFDPDGVFSSALALPG